jgi:hypothetical protein
MLWTDDYLAAFAQGSDVTLATLDKKLPSRYSLGPRPITTSLSPSKLYHLRRPAESARLRPAPERRPATPTAQLGSLERA